MQYMTVQRNIGDSPRKLRLVADMVRKMSPEQAILTLQFTQRAAAKPLIEAIKTVLANANGKSGLTFQKIEINEGLKMRRYRVGTAGRGRNRPYKKRLSHIKIVLTDEVVSLANLKSKTVETPFRVDEVLEAPAKKEVKTADKKKTSEKEVKVEKKETKKKGAK
jgi:large subunit ribosomal protein L22